MEKKSSYKTVLLGESSVGKSSIVLRLTKDTFHDNTNTTIGACNSCASGSPSPLLRL